MTPGSLFLASLGIVVTLAAIKIFADSVRLSRLQKAAQAEQDRELAETMTQLAESVPPQIPTTPVYTILDRLPEPQAPVVADNWNLPEPTTKVTMPLVLPPKVERLDKKTEAPAKPPRVPRAKKVVAPLATKVEIVPVVKVEKVKKVPVDLPQVKDALDKMPKTEPKPEVVAQINSPYPFPMTKPEEGPKKEIVEQYKDPVVAPVKKTRAPRKPKAV